MIGFWIFSLLACSAVVSADYSDVLKLERSLMTVNTTVYQKVSFTLQDEKNGMRPYLDRASQYTSYLCVINAALTYTNTYSKPLLNSWLEYELQKIANVKNRILSANLNQQGVSDMLSKEAQQVMQELENDFKTWTATISGVKKESLNKMGKCVQ